MTTVKTAKSEKFGWNEENAVIAIDMYQKSVAENGVEVANVDTLADIMKAVGANSVTQVRSKLVSAKVYQKSDKPRKVGGGSALRKAHYVRAFANAAIDQGIIEDADELASLELPKLETLDVLAKMLDIKVTAE